MTAARFPRFVHLLATRTLILIGVLAPINMTVAQDYEAIEKRLGKAVAAGEIDLEQAQVMMHALRQSGGRDAEARRMREGVEHRINEIKKMIDAGKISREDGARKIEETRRSLKSAPNRDADARRMREGVEYRINEIKKMVDAGKLSPEDGKRLVEETRRSLGKSKDRE